MRNESATIPPCPPPSRPTCWSAIRDELYPALRGGLGLTEEAALAAAERGADAAIVESRLVPLAEAQRWGRPFTGETVAVAVPTPAHGIPQSLVDAFTDMEARIRNLGALALLVEGMAHLVTHGAALERQHMATVVGLMCGEARALDEGFDGFLTQGLAHIAGQAVRS